MLKSFNIHFLNNNIFKRDLLVVSLILVLPFLFYLYTIIPEDKSEFNILWFNFESGFFNDVAYFVWLIFVKFFTLSILSLWFITCNQKWKFVILVPIYFEMFKIFSILDFYERGEWINISIFNPAIKFIIYISILFWISFKLKYMVFKRSFNKRINNEINLELEAISYSQRLDRKKINNNLLKLRKKKSHMKKRDYLVELIQLRDQLSQKK